MWSGSGNDYMCFKIECGSLGFGKIGESSSSEVVIGMNEEESACAIRVYNHHFAILKVMCVRD